MPQLALEPGNTLNATPPASKLKDASSKELEKAKLLLRDWANLSSLLVLAFSAWAITYADLGPQWVHHEEARPRLISIIKKMNNNVCNSIVMIIVMGIIK